MNISIGLSGGVDSSYAAYKLLESGHRVSGYFLQLTDNGNKGSISLAGRVAEKLNIPFTVLDLRNEFRDIILQYFMEEYIQGKTPNPCIKCNRLIKFGDILFNELAEFGEVTATGHYARIIKDETRGVYYLKKGVDPAKDQSYFLSTLNQEQLARIILPLGNYFKADVQMAVSELDLVPADIVESQELCFIENGHYSDFIKSETGLEFSPGPILHVDGSEIGTHTGLINYTIGQRKGLGIAWPEPLYVIRILPESNSIVAGEDRYLFSSKFVIRDFFWIWEEFKKMLPFPGRVKIRYLNKPGSAEIRLNRESEIEVEFKKPVRAITPGQHACVYKRDKVIGGGTISKTFLKGGEDE